MDPQTDLPDLVEDLEVNIDELTTSLAPLLTPLAQTASTLPLLDKAKLYVLAAYSIESLLFSTLLATGADPKQHALFPELARLKTYFAKIKDVESRAPGGEWEKRARVDTAAAARFIKHGLSGNERYDVERRERERQARERAAEKARLLVNKKFPDASDNDATPKKRGVDDIVSDDSSKDGGEAPTPKKPRTEADAQVEAEDTPDDAAPPVQNPTKHRPRPKKAKQPSSSDGAGAAGSDTPEPKHPRKKRNTKKLKGAYAGDNEEVILPSRAPKTRSETFSALLEGKAARGGSPNVGAKGSGKGRGKKPAV